MPAPARIPLASHDDTTLEEVEQILGKGGALETVREPSSQAHVAAFLKRTGKKHFEKILGYGS